MTDSDDNGTRNARVVPIRGMNPSKWRPGPRPSLDEIDKGSDAELAGFLIARWQHRSPVVSAEGSLWVYEHESGCWAERSKAQVRKEILQLDGLQHGLPDTNGRRKTLRISNHKAAAVHSAALFLLDEDQEPFADAPHGLVTSNGFLTVSDGQLILYPHHHEWYQRLKVPFAYDPGAQCPRWMQALSEWFGADGDGGQKEAMLQEFFGAALCGLATPFGRALFVVGTGGQGKSQITEVLAGLLPKERVGSVPPQRWSKEYDADRLSGLALNVVNELPSKAIAEGSAFKAIITGDSIHARPIYGQPYDFRPRAAHIFSANHLPRSLDGSDGFWRRVLLLRMTRQFQTTKGPAKGHVQNLGAQILATEAAGVLAWAVAGAQRLLEQATYTIAASSHREVEQWRLDSDPLLQWLQERTEPCQDNRLKALSRELWNDWKQWTQDNGYQSGGKGHWASLMADRTGPKKRTERGNTYPICLKSRFNN